MDGKTESHKDHLAQVGGNDGEHSQQGNMIRSACWNDCPEQFSLHAEEE